MSSFNVKRRTPYDVTANLTTPGGEPLTTFGDLSVSELESSGQGDFVYGINTQIFSTRTYSGGSVTNETGSAVVKSGTSSTGSAFVTLRRNLKYKPGLGSLCRLTALFDTPKTQNYQQAGVGNAECGYYFGYNGTNFGIFHEETSQREIRRVTITTPAGTELVNVTLNGVTVSVPVTGGANANRTAYELARYDYTGVGTGWFADAIDGTVYYVSGLPGAFTGSYNLSGSTATGSFASIVVGSGSTMTFTSQSSWNIDRLDGGASGGPNPSGMTINPQKGNVYQIGFQYLGYGNAFFGVEDSRLGRITPVHMVQNADARTTPVLKNPQTSVRLISRNFGNTTSVQPKTVSMAQFTEGKNIRLDPRFSATASFASLSSTTYVGLLALKVNKTFNDLVCYGEIDILRITGNSNSNGVSIAVFKDVPINGNVNFTYVNQTNSIVSEAYLGATGTSITTNGFTPLATFAIGNGGSAVLDLPPEELVTAAGEILIFAIKTFAGSNPTGEISINWFEQQ